RALPCGLARLRTSLTMRKAARPVHPAVWPLGGSSSGRYAGATMTTLDGLLDDLAAYLGTPDHACLSLPPAAYTAPDLHAPERARIFAHSWLCVGRDEYVANPGDYYRIDVLDEPIIVVRGVDGVVRALNAACRHRSMLVVQGRGNARGFTCPYHSWSYATHPPSFSSPHLEPHRPSAT